MNRHQYERALDAFFSDIQAEALRLFDSGVPLEMCVNLAMKIVEARDVAKIRTAQQFSVAPGTRLSAPPKQ